jgi:hypothetical protein
MKKNSTFILYLYKIKINGVELPIYAPTQFENYLLKNNIKYVRYAFITQHINIDELDRKVREIVNNVVSNNLVGK